ncbi:sugar phosphate nucleotidyltransferase [Bradyrhizobium sp.]
MQCVILAGGMGTRIVERSGGLPKALIPVLGKPFLFYQLEWLARQNVRDVVLSVGYKGDLIRAAVGNGSDFELSVTYADEGNVLRGTGGALRYVADLGLLQKSFFVMYGDSYLPVDLCPVWRTSEQGQVATMTVLRNEGRWDKSNVIFRNGTLLLYDKFAAAPAALDMDYIDFGLSVLTREAIIQGIASGSKMDLARLFNKLSLEGRLRGHEVLQRFYEIGSPQGLDDFETYLRTTAGIGRHT